MADTTNLSQFLGDVADAIRTKKGTTETIPAANFDTEIASIETGSDTSDATATADDILQGTTAYIADGKVEGNIQKIEEAADDTPVVSTEELGSTQVVATCFRHKLIITDQHIINYETGESVVAVPNSYIKYACFADSDITSNSVVIGVIYYYNGYTATTLTLNLSNMTVTKGVSQSMNGKAMILPHPTSSDTFFTVDESYIYQIDATSSVKKANKGLGSSAYINHCEWNRSKTKFLAQSYRYIRSDWYYRYVVIYDLLTNTAVSIQTEFGNSGFDNWVTWYDDDTFLIGNQVFALSSGAFAYVKTLSTLKYGGYKFKFQTNTDKLWIETNPGNANVVALVMDTDTDEIISEEIIYSGNFKSPLDSNNPISYSGEFAGIEYYTEDNTTKYRAVIVSLGAEKIITGLTRLGINYLDTHTANANSAMLLKGYTAYNNNGKMKGTMTNNGTLNYTPSAEEQTIPAGYTSGGKVSGDSNLTANNIKLGVSIFGVEGNLEPDKPDQTKTATPTTEEQVITPDTGYELASVTVEAVTSDIDSNIVAENIKSGVTILGVDGTFEGGTQLPDGIFVQDTIPTDVSTESILLLSSDSSDTRPSNLIPASLNNWGTIKASLTEEQLTKFDSYKYHFVCYYIIGTNVMPSVNLDTISFSSAMLIDNDGVSNYSTSSVNRTLLSWSDVDVYYGDTLFHASDVNLEDNSLHATIGDMKYTVYKKDSTTAFEKILDTSNADATAGDIVEGKTAFVNNTKITGTLTVPMSQEEYNTALSTANNILGEEVTE